MVDAMARTRNVAKAGGHAAILVFFVTFLAFPFYWMIITTFKTTRDLYDTAHNPYLFSDPPTWHHLQVLFGNTQYLQWIGNTAFVGVVVVIITLALALPAGYALARMTGAWAQNLGIAIFLTYLVPPTILFIPFSRIIGDLGLQDSLWSLVLVYPSFTVPFCTWLLMGFFKAIPSDLEDAAMIDGLSRFGAFVKVVLPQISVSVFISGLLAFVTSFDQVETTMFLMRPGESTLPIEMFLYLQKWQDPTIAALSTLLILFAAGLLLLLGAMMRRKRLPLEILHRGH